MAAWRKFDAGHRQRARVIPFFLAPLRAAGENTSPASAPASYTC